MIMIAVRVVTEVKMIEQQKWKVELFLPLNHVIDSLSRLAHGMETVRTPSRSSALNNKSRKIGELWCDSKKKWSIK